MHNVTMVGTQVRCVRCGGRMMLAGRDRAWERDELACLACGAAASTDDLIHLTRRYPGLPVSLQRCRKGHPTNGVAVCVSCVDEQEEGTEPLEPMDGRRRRWIKARERALALG